MAQLDLSHLTGGAVSFLDADTYRDSEGKVRAKDLYAPEIEHIGPDGEVKNAEHGGMFRTELYKNLAEQTGYDSLFRSGDQGFYDRDLGYLTNKDGSNFTKKLVYEGLEQPTTESQQELYDMGVFTRALDEAEGKTDTTDPWHIAREDVLDYYSKTFGGYKRMATNEKSLASANEYYGGPSYSPYQQTEVNYRHTDRDILNNANSNFGTGFEFGWKTILENSSSAYAALGDVLGNKDMYEEGMAEAERKSLGVDSLPEFSNDVHNVDWKSPSSIGDWMAGSFGVSLPFMIEIFAAGAVGAAVGGPMLAGVPFVSLVPMLWTYTGEAYGQMEGDMDQKNAGIAYSAGLAMSLLDRLALKAILKPSDLMKKDAFAQVARIHAKENNITEEAAKKIIMTETGTLSALALKDIRKFSQIQLSKSLLAKEIGYGGLRGATIETVAELGQESAGYLGAVVGSELEYDQKRYERTMANAAAGGFVMGGTIATAATAKSSFSGFRRVQNEFNLRGEAPMHYGSAEKFAAEIMKEVEDFSVTTDAFGVDVRGTRDWSAESDAERAAGDRLDTSVIRGGDKQITTSLAEFPRRFVSKHGSIIYDKFIKNGKMPEQAKKVLGAILTQYAPANVNLFSDQDILEKKRRIKEDLMAKTGFIEALLFDSFEVRKNSKEGKEVLKVFERFLNEKLEKKSDAQISKEYSLSVDGELKTLTTDQITTLNELRNRIGQGLSNGKGVTDELYRTFNILTRETYGRKGEPTVGKKKGWFQLSTKLREEEVTQDREGWIAYVMDGDNHFDNKGWTQAKAEEVWETIVNGPPGYKMEALADLKFSNWRPSSVKESKGILNTIDWSNSKFAETDPFQRLRMNIEEQTNYAVDVNMLGKNDAKIDKQLMHLKDLMGPDWDPRIVSWVKDSVAAGRGDYRRMDSQFLERMIGHMTFFNTFVHLGLSTLASLPEMAMVYMAASKDQSLMQMMQAGAEDTMSHFFYDGNKAWSYIKPGGGISSQQYNRNLIDFYRMGLATSTHGVIGQTGIDSAIYKTSRIKESLMQAFFFANGLKLYTDTTRIVRLSLANDAIFGDLEILGMFPKGHPARQTGLWLDAFERIRELNIDPEVAAKTYTKIITKLNQGHQDSKGDWVEGVDTKEIPTKQLYEILLAMEPRFMDTMDVARMSFVDNAIAHPTATNRPLWYSNPHYRLFTQYNGFMSVFTAHILPKMWKRVKSDNPNARYEAVATMGMMLMFGFMSQWLKDEYKYGNKPGWITDKGYIQRGIVSSGLVGTPEKFLSIFSPIYETQYQSFGRQAVDAAEGLAGPTYAHLGNIAEIFTSYLDGDKDRSKAALVNEIPLIGNSPQLEAAIFGINK